DGDTTDEASTSAADETLLLVEGSTGGAGLRGLQGDEPEPLAATILYFDPETRQLVAYDSITVAWLQDAGATIERHIVGEAGDGTGDGPGEAAAGGPVTGGSPTGPPDRRLALAPAAGRP
ncbi:MAG TPA: hypothetical protein VF015_07185, partial [Acidimicrobiales bacterium]